MTPPKTLRIASVAITEAAEAKMPSEFGDFRVFAFNMNDGREAAAMVAGDVAGKEDVLARDDGLVQCWCRRIARGRLRR